MNVPSSSIHNSPKRETAQVPVSWWMDKQFVYILQDGILLRERERIKNTGWDKSRFTIAFTKQSLFLYYCLSVIVFSIQITINLLLPHSVHVSDNMDGSQKHFAKWQKLHTTDHTLCDPIYMMSQKRQRAGTQSARWLPGTRGGWVCKGPTGSLWHVELPPSSRGLGIQLHVSVKTHRAEHQKGCILLNVNHLFIV